MKAEIIFDRIGTELAIRSSNLNQLRYRRYLFAVHAFSKKKRDDLRVERKRISNALTQAEREQRKLISQRAEMISQNLFDPQTQKQFDTRIKELSECIDDLKYRRKGATTESDSRILTFQSFLELRENLVLYWKMASYPQKAIFSKIAISNLSLNDQEVAILSFKKPFLDDEKGCFASIGGRREARLEPRLQAMWDWLQCSQHEQYIKEIMDMIEQCRPSEKLQFPLISDLEKISGTKL